MTGNDGRDPVDDATIVSGPTVQSTIDGESQRYRYSGEITDATITSVHTEYKRTRILNVGR